MRDLASKWVARCRDLERCFVSKDGRTRLALAGCRRPPKAASQWTAPSPSTNIGSGPLAGGRSTYRIIALSWKRPASITSRPVRPDIGCCLSCAGKLRGDGEKTELSIDSAAQRLLSCLPPNYPLQPSAGVRHRVISPATMCLDHSSV